MGAATPSPPVVSSSLRSSPNEVHREGEEMNFLNWFAAHPFLGTFLVVVLYALIDSTVVNILNTVAHIMMREKK
jgi:hypothetical protein